MNDTEPEMKAVSHKGKQEKKICWCVWEPE